MPLSLLKRQRSAARLAVDHPQPESEYPRVIQLETTGVCNLRCVMCPTTYAPTNKTLSREAFAPILEALPHVDGFVPYLGGEPLLYKGFFDLVEQARAVAPNIYIGFNTNGTLLSDEICEKIVRLRVSEVIVSMDGAVADTYNRIRIRANFDDVVENMRRLVRAKGSCDRPHLATLMVASRQNVEEIIALVHLAAELGLQKVLINGLEPYTPEDVPNVLYAESPDPHHISIFARAAEASRRLGLEFVTPSLRATKESRYCPALSVCIIRADGEVYPCYQFAQNDRFFHHGREMKHQGPLSFGNIHNTSVRDIWNSAAYRSFRDDLRLHNLGPECSHCLVAEGVTCNVQPYRL
jgi:radical SAM protein with 4Fe4S-binding SPASM domain